MDAMMDRERTTRALSDEGSAVPRLAMRARGLDDAALQRLAAALLPSPAGELPRRLMRLFEQIGAIAQHLPFADDKRPENRRLVLRETEALMHEQNSLHDYLLKVIRALDPAGDKRRAERVLASVDREVDLLFATPINKVKHDAYQLAWLEARPKGAPHEVIRGYLVEGIIDVETTGSAAHVFGTNAIAESYSYALLLRKAVVLPYVMCELAEDAIRSSVKLREPVGKDADNSKVTEAAKEALMHLAGLPRRGFPNEHGQRVPDVVWHDDAVRVVRWFKLGPLPDGSTIQQAATYHPGYALQLQFAGRCPPTKKVRK